MITPVNGSPTNEPATTADAFLGGRLMIRQPLRGYRAGFDAIVLAASCPQPEMTTGYVLDCGAGVGTVGLAIASRCPKVEVTLVEAQSELVGLAQSNIIANGLTSRVTAIEADLAAPLSKCPGLASRTSTFDHVVANPPFFADNGGTRAANPSKAASHAMQIGGLEAWVKFAAAMAKPGGTFTLIHRAEALDEILSACRRRFGALRILPIHTQNAAPATRIIVSGIKNSRAPLMLLAGRTVHEADGKTFKPEIEAVLRAGAAYAL